MNSLFRIVYLLTITDIEYDLYIKHKLVLMNLQGIRTHMEINLDTNKLNGSGSHIHLLVLHRVELNKCFDFQHQQ